MRRTCTVIGAAAGLLLACNNDASGPRTPERPLYYLKAPTNSGDRQSDTVLATLPLPFRVLVRRGDAPVSGIEVRWEIPADPQSGVARLDTTSRTDNGGIATSPFKLTFGSISRSYAVRASVQGVFVPSPIELFTDVDCGEGLCFTATARPAPPRHLRYIAGDGQVGTVGETLDANHVVQSTDAYGNGSPGAVISWEVTAGGGTIAPTQTTTAPPYGMAAARLTLGPVDETHRVRATAALPGAPSVTFSATGFSAFPVASVTVTPESISVQADRTAQLSAVLRDANGRVIIRRHTTWTSLDPAVAIVDTSGLVRGLSPGSTRVTAESEGISDTAAITVTEGPPPVIFASIIAGWDHSCGLRSDGAAYCWGDNSVGQLGNSNVTTQLTPVAVVGGYVFTSLVAGSQHTCGLTSAGKAYCWGRGDDGQLGNGHTANAAIPVPVDGGHTFTSLGTGGFHTCGVTSSGSAYCWGWNEYGQLGDGRFSNALTPVAVAGPLNFVTLSTGRGWHTCGVTSTGAAHCWGRNLESQLGVPSPDESATPVAVSGNLSFTMVVTGVYHSCGVTTGGIVQCWGDNHWGQLGDGFNGFERAIPGPVSGSADIKTLTAAAGHSCQVSNVGTASCWGLNDVGQLGNGSTSTTPLLPVAVFGGHTFSLLAGGGGHTCGLNSSGVAYCWGYNGSGHLGDGTTTNSPLPVRVVSGP